MGDSTPTIADVPRAQESVSRLTSRTRTLAEPRTIELSEPETVLRRSEIEQARRTAIAGVVFNLAGLALAPFFGGHPLAKQLFVAGLGGALLNNAWLWYASASEARYRERHVITYFALAPIFNAAVMAYLGVFSPILVIFVLNLYTVCLSFNRRVARVTFAGSVAPVAILGALIATGALADPGLIRPTAHMGNLGQAAMIVLFVLFLYLVYEQARRGREVMVASLVERDQAVRQASHREALFLEARQDLERALDAGGLGRFTDQILGNYRLGAILGRGGMGEVYEAVHVESGEPAAVKMLLPEVLRRPDYVRRFLREVRIAASLDSPHVVKVLEVGDESAPLPFLAMERLVGEDLAQILRLEERMRPPAVVELVRQVGRGLGAAARAGIVHRDLKPQNLFFAEGPPRLWKILDFGVSKLIAGEGTITQGETIGTPQYMAPEQARGGTVDARADLYSLGAIAYRAITGHQPFRGDDLGQLLMAVIGELPVRPGALVPVPHDVDLVLAIALAKEPDDRFQSAVELADALEAAFARRLDRATKRRALSLLHKTPYADVEERSDPARAR